VTNSRPGHKARAAGGDSAAGGGAAGGGAASGRGAHGDGVNGEQAADGSVSGSGPAGNESSAGTSGPDQRGGPGGSAGGERPRDRPRMPPVRLAPREELAAAARVAPLLRAARDLSSWADRHPEVSASQVLDGSDARAAADALELTEDELDAAWQVVAAASEQAAAGDPLPSRDKPLASCDADELLREWDAALAALLAAEELDGLATALYTVGAPVRIDALFDAYSAAAGSSRDRGEEDRRGGTAEAANDESGSPAGAEISRAGQGRLAGGAPDPSEAAALSHALETLADLGVVELGTEENAGGLTVGLSPLGIWGVHRRLLAQGWHVPVLGGADRNGAVGLLVTLASCDAEDGEAEISSWLVGRTEEQAAAELIAAAAEGSPGLRGAAFAVLDRIGKAAIEEVRTALGHPLLRAHAAVWLHEHGEEAELGPADRTWLLVDLGAGLLEEADPRDVVAELLPDVTAEAQAEIVAGLWQVDHPGVIDLLTTLSEHHQDPGVARAARKAAFKARSPGSGARQRTP
jgi:hypothetical protein